MVESIPKGDYWQVDQEFLTAQIYPLVQHKAMVHDEFYEKSKLRFPVTLNILWGKLMMEMVKFSMIMNISRNT